MLKFFYKSTVISLKNYTFTHFTLQQYIALLYLLKFLPKFTKERGVLILDTIEGHAVGDVHVIVYETEDGDSLFRITTNNEKVSPIADIIEDTLTQY